jgi:hypothetical protein
MSRKRIYLDKCFWIYLRDANLGRSKVPEAQVLLQLLTQAVTGDRVICPISDVLFLELLKQTDLASRAATVDLIDQLSRGVSLVPHEERFKIESQQFFLTHLDQSLPPVEHLVWTKVGYVLGVIHPLPPPNLDAEGVQIGFFDFVWDRPLRQIMSVIGDREPPESLFEEQAAELNRLNAEHAPDMKSYPQVYKDEVQGVLELATPVGLAAIRSLEGAPMSATAGNAHIDARAVHALLCAAIAKPDGRRALRTAHLQATFHAAVRWNRTKRLKANDLPDFLHAQAGIGYCDALLTDGPTKHLADQKNLRIGDDFPCMVIASVPDAVSWMRHG